MAGYRNEAAEEEQEERGEENQADDENENYLIFGCL